MTVKPGSTSAERALDAVRAKIAALETGGRGESESLPFGDPRIDRCFPGGRGLPLRRWHEVGGEGMETETAAAPAAFAALMALPLLRKRPAVWITRRDDLHAPGLAGLGFPAGALIEVWARDEAQALAAAEDALAASGVGVVFVEAQACDLTAGRRLQLACEKGQATGFLIARRPFGGGAAGAAQGSAAASRWSIAPAPSAPMARRPGLGAPRWRATLERCRGGRPGAWLFESPAAYDDTEIQDGTHPLRLVADLGDRQLAPTQPAARPASPAVPFPAGGQGAPRRRRA
ncbi:ImuA family protein [Phenylobacterium sp.]|uniref:ImuA family protein n=1 Tax=Phenylobacterium sp. TaxID=1871053 RepID=UPI002731AF64|nr:protein imuA [Phenylobacterium sp.]MDP2213363.1 protein imuA [Phenylobacterium sp.]